MKTKKVVLTLVLFSFVVFILNASKVFSYELVDFLDYPVSEGIYIPGSYNCRSFLAPSNHLGDDINPFGSCPPPADNNVNKNFEGAPVYSIGNGKLFIYRSAGAYGELVAVIEHDLGKKMDFINGNGNIISTRYLLSIYGHIRKNEVRGDNKPLPWKVGDEIPRGFVIGYINDSSHPDCVIPDCVIPDHNGHGYEHLHFGIRLSSKSVAEQKDIDWFRGYDTWVANKWKYRGDFANPKDVIESLRCFDIPRNLSLARIEGKDPVYWLQNGRAYHILSMDIINNMSNLSGWNHICDYPPNALEIISIGPVQPDITFLQGPDFITTGTNSDGLLIKLPDNPKVYLIENGERRWITTDATFKALGYNSDDIIIVTQDILDLIPAGDSITINIDVSLIIDSSGSMGWNDPKNLRKEAAEIFVGVAQNEDQIAIIDFDSYMKTLWHLQPLTENRDGIIAAINSIDSSGGTNIGKGLLGGYYELLSSSEPNSRAAVLLTDGDGSYYGEAELFKTEGWPIHTIGLGSSANSALLKNIADETGGIYFPLNDANQLKNVYFEIATHITGGTSIFGKNLYMLTGDFYELLVNVPLYQQMVTFLISWPGSDVSTTLVTPSGGQITPDTIDTDVYHAKGLTYELYRINNPEPGEWAVGLTGVDLSPGGEEVSVSASSVGLAAPVDTTPPIISISNPVNGKTYFDQLPTNFSFVVEDPESAITDQTATLNNNPINNNDDILLTQLGKNTLTITATNEVNLTSELSITFYINHFSWLPPIKYEKGSATQTITYVAQANSTLPIKFAIFDANSSFVENTTVKVVVEGTTAQFTHGEGDTNIRINQEEGEDPLYIVNLHTNFNKCDYGLEAGNEYNLTVYFNDILAARTKLRIK